MSSLPPILLLLSMDQMLAGLVEGATQQPWILRLLAAQGADSQIFAQPNVRLFVLDDEAVESGERGRLLWQIRRYLPGASLIYVAGAHSDIAERQARTGGAHYYISKPISPPHLQYVLQSFMRAQI